MGKAYLSGRTALARALAAVTILLGVALALPVLPAEASSVPTNGTDVGGMNLSAYCSGLGFSGSGLRRAQIGADAAYNNWICLKSGSTKKIPIDLNAACSKTFAQRPLLAETPNSDDAFAWHCYQTASSMPQGLTGTTVGCNFIVASADDVCTATVTDNGVPSRTPTGQVDFYSSGGGTFTSGQSCQLGNPSGTAASCRVTFVPPSGAAPVFLAGAYGGDSGPHSTSSGVAKVLSLDTAQVITASGNGTTHGSNVNVGVDCKIPCEIFAELDPSSAAAAAIVARAHVLGNGKIMLLHAGRGTLKIKLTAAELQKLKQHHIHQFKARLKLTIKSLSGRVLDHRTMVITVHVR